MTTPDGGGSKPPRSLYEGLQRPLVTRAVQAGRGAPVGPLDGGGRGGARPGPPRPAPRPQDNNRQGPGGGAFYFCPPPALPRLAWPGLARPGLSFPPRLGRLGRCDAEVPGSSGEVLELDRA